MSNVTVIDAKRGLRPRSAPGDAEIAARLAALQEKAAGRDAHGLLELALTEEFRIPAAYLTEAASVQLREGVAAQVQAEVVLPAHPDRQAFRHHSYR